MSEIYVYAPLADDFDCMGLCGALTPTSCIHTEEANGMSEIELEHPIDPNGRWSFLLDGYIIKADVPVRTTPEIVNGAFVTTVEKWVVKSNTTKANRYLYTKASGGKKKKLLPKNLAVTVVAKHATANRHKVKTKKYGSGWLAVSAMDHQITETIPNDPFAIEQVEPAWTVRSQLFRIDSHEVSESGVTVHARHIFYDLLGNITTYDSAAAGNAATVGNPTAIEAGEGIMDGCIAEHEFEFHTNMLDTRGGVKWTRINPVTALLDPEEGLCAQWGAELIRDDWDIIVLREAGFNRGVRIEYAKNLLGVKCETDTSDVITRVVPVGQTSKGGALGMGGTEPWLDSPRIHDYPVPHIFVYDLGSKVKAKSTSSSDVTAARTKLRLYAEQKFEDEKCDEPSVSLKVDFLALGTTAEYRDFAQMEALFLFDRVTVKHPDLQIDVLCEVKRMEFDCLSERPLKIELGSVKFLTTARPFAQWQIPTGLNGETKLARDSITEMMLAEGSVTDKSIGEGAVGELALQDGSVTFAKLRAGFFEAQEIHAELANIVTANLTTANIQNANIEWASIANLNAQIATLAQAQITTANIQTAHIDWASIANLNAQIATIAQAQIGEVEIDFATIDWASIATLNAQIATIAKAQITAANIETANIQWADIASLNAVIATIATAQITTAHINQANINWASIVSLNAAVASIAKAQITTANITQANIDWANIVSLNAAVASIAKAQITTANIISADIAWGSIASLQAGIAEIVSARIGAADIDYAHIKDVVAGTAIIREGIGGKLFIDRLAVTEANIVSLSVGELMIKGSDGQFYKLVAGPGGSVTTEAVKVEGSNVANGTLSGNNLIQNTITARELNVSSIFADSAMIGVIKAANIDVASLFASSAYITALRTNIIQSDIGTALNITSNAAILLKADKTVTDGLATRLTTAESKITPEAIVSTVRGSSSYTSDLAAKLATATYNTDKSALQAADVAVGTSAPSSPPTGKLWVDTSGTSPQLKRWTGSAWQIVTDLSKADAAALTALAGRVTTAETNITQTQSSISLKADKSVTDGLNTRLTSAESKITPESIVSTVRGSSQYTSDLAAKLATSTYNTDKTALQNADVAVGSTAPSSPPTGKLWVDTSGASPQLKRWTGSAWQIVTDLSKADAAALTALAGRVTTAETNITQTQSSISLKADKSVTDGLNTRLTSAESKITPTAIVSTVRSSSQYTTDLAAKLATSTYNTDKTALQNADVAVDSTAPGSPPTGKLWVDTSGTVPQLKRWAGSAWQIVTDLSKADASALTALTTRVTNAETKITQNQSSISLKADKSVTDGLNTRLSSAESKITPTAIVSTVTSSAAFTSAVAAQAGIPTGTTAPSSPSLNKLWFNTSIDPPRIMSWDGEEWVAVDDDSALLTQLSTSITQTAEMITQTVSKADLSRYLSFSAQSGVLIGDTATSYKVQILSDRVNILQNGAVIAYFASSKLYITEGELTSSLKIGNYGLKRTADGGIAIG